MFYRLADKSVPVNSRILEERIVAARQRLPGPIRRLLFLLLVVPVILGSFLLFLVAAPICWVLTGSVESIIDYIVVDEPDHYIVLDEVPLLRGTCALFWDYTDCALSALRLKRY